MPARRVSMAQVHRALDRVGLWTAARGGRRRASPGERPLLHYASHALLSPLTACRWQLELLGDEPEERRKTIAVITNELKRMERVLHDLGVLADAGEPDFLRLERFDLELFVHELVAEASTRAERAWTLDRAEGWMVGDAYRLGEVVMTLVETAVAHTDENDVVAIGASVGDDDVRLWVRVTGPGVPPEEKTRLLEQLVHGVEAAPRRDDRALRLAVAGTIVEAHGGHVELESKLGEGSTIAVVVPTRSDHWSHLLPWSRPQP